MKNFQFLEIIIDGILKNELHLKNYLIRKQKEAENKNYFSEIEFYQKCSAVITQLESNIELQFTDRKKKLQQTIELLKSKNNPFKKELKASENLSLDSFYINLSIYTKGKYEGELWLSQINYIKKCIDEIHSQKFKITTEIKDLDIDKYLNFIFSKKAISSKNKENAVVILMNENNQESTEENYQIWRDYVFNQQKYWKTLTKKDKKSFEELRTMSLNETNTLFEKYIKGSPKPTINLEKEFEAAILKRLAEEPFLKTTYEFIQGLLPQDINKLAIIIGKLDFIKNLKNQKEKILPEKWYALLYWFELKVSGNEPPKNAEGNFIKSEIKAIGALRCNSTGLSFYNNFKDIPINNKGLLTNMFGNDWKDVIKKISNNNPEIIKYIDKNY
ncbi:hypothetical protein [Flavobacterium sp.]|jgi:hypothetical protein|uniref:hypothetical protein n=1 Tax=Flavobacterium sp. TaxID=239 RepID=UPI0037BF13FE